MVETYDRSKIINYLQLNDDDIYKRSVQEIEKLGAL